MAASILEVLVTGDAASLVKALDQASSSAKEMESATNSATQGTSSKLASVGTALKSLAPAFLAIGATAVAGIAKGIQATQQWASDTRLLQRITGDTAESASSLLTASSLLGVSTSTLSTGFGILSKNIVNGSSSLAKYSIETQDAHGNTLPFDDVLGNIIDKFATLQPGAEQTAFAMNVFGRSGKDLIPILSKGRQGIAELEAKAADLGLVMGQDDVDASKALAASQRELGLAFKGAFISIGKLFIPALTKVVNVVTQAVEFFTKLPDPVKEIGIGAALAAGAVGGLTLAFGALQKTFSPVIEGLTGVGKALVESGLFQDAAAALGVTASGVEAVGAAAQGSGQQLQLFGDSSSSALQAVGDATSVATLAVTATAGKQVSFFELVGAKIAQVGGGIGEALSGIGSSIVSALASPVGIIAAVAAAVAVLAVVVVKNWDTIKQAIGPGIAGFLQSALQGFTDAIGQVGSALGDLVSSFSDLGSAISTAFAPLAPLLAPIAGILAKVFGGVLIGPFLLLLKATTVGFQVLGTVIKFTATIVEGVANLIIGAVNAVIGQINNVIGASNKWLHTNFGLIPTVQTLDTSASSAATSTGDLAGAADGAADSQDKLGRSIGISSAQLQKAAPLLQAMGTNFHTLASAAQDAFDAAQSSGADTTAAFQAFSDAQIQAAKDARAAFQSQAASALTFTTSMLSDLESAAVEAQKTLAGDTSSLDNSQLAALRDQANLTARDILNTFNAAGDQTRTFGRDLLEVAHIGGKAGRDLANSLLQSGDVLAAQVIADSPAKIQKQIVGSFGRSESAANDLSSKLTDAIVGPLNDIRGVLIRLANQVFGLHIDHKQVDTAKTAVANLNESIQNLDTSVVFDIKLHTHGSDLPDEVMRKHLFDPMKRQGFRKEGPRWALPLDVNVHTNLEKTAKLGIGASLTPVQRDMTMGFKDAGFIDRLLKNAPRLPRGHTNIDNSLPNHPRLRQSMVVNLDRRHFDDELSYQTSYARGY